MLPFARSNLALTDSYEQAALVPQLSAKIIPLSAARMGASKYSEISQRQLAAQKALQAEMIANGEVVLIKPHFSNPDQRPYYHQSFLTYKRSLGL